MVGLLGLFAGFMAIMVFIVIAAYIYMAVALMTIAKKTKTKDAWMAWIPIANLYLMTKIADVPTWTILAFLLLFIPVLGGLAFMAVYIWWWWKIAEARKMEGWLSILLVLPVINLVIVGIIAWKD